MRLEATRHYNNVFPNVTPYASQFSSADMVFKQAAFDTEADVMQYVKLLDQYSEVQKSELAKLRSMEAHGIRLAKPEIELTLGLLKTWQVEATKHGYYPQSGRLQKLDSSLQK